MDSTAAATLKLGKNSRRSYSPGRLEKAIADIQSGRIGTRKASSLYGIPRSTLRNKVVRIKNQLKSNLTQQEPKETVEKIEDNQKDEEEDDSFRYRLESELIYNDALNIVMLQCDDDDNQPIGDKKKSSRVLLALRLIRRRLARRLVGSRTKLIAKMIRSTKKRKESSFQTAQHHQQQLEETECSLKPLRAKRGQYRKYESTQLNNAVDAVIQGSMSVHRAGSIFGVPHSTLEYKVKEKLTKKFLQ